LAPTQVFDDFLFEVIFRVDMSITDQFESSNGTVFCRISYFYFFLSKKFDKLVKYLDIFVRSLSSQIYK